jgi:hypothetical protein
MLEAALGGIVELLPMSGNSADTSEVVKFEPKERPHRDDTPAEEAGQAIIAKIKRAADLANENCDRAMRLAHKLAMEVRAAEDRINQLEAEVQLFRDRAARAEHWLQTVAKADPHPSDALRVPETPPSLEAWAGFWFSRVTRRPRENYLVGAEREAET